MSRVKFFAKQKVKSEEVVMEIRKLVLGQLGVNCYVLGSKNVAVVDPGDRAKDILNYLEQEGLVLDKILVTHGHFDHVGALKELKELTGARVYMHKDDIPMLGDKEKSLGFMIDTVPEKTEVDVVLSGGEEIEVDGETIKVIHTPGHSQGSVCYIGENFVCDGDLIFKASIGRYDFGDYCAEMGSIRKLLSLIGDDTLILPGHGEETTKRYEKENNPYIR